MNPVTSLGRVLGSSPLARGLRLHGDPKQGPLRIIPARAGFTRRRSRCGSAGGDHPRSRGVYSLVDEEDATTEGSSPLARGLPVDDGLDGRVGGIIPARAGFTPWRASSPARPPDHPRSRGVYIMPATNHTSNFRIIPARAGFTRTSPSIPPSSSDHPRSRGVYGAARPAVGPSGGSSPLARGLPGGVGLREERDRIIPARAGFTSRPRRTGRPGPDHPRSRGVY